MPDFFISYTAADKVWAEWIAWVLEHAGYRVVFQEWDFAAGSNFVLEMQKAAATAKRTIAVLSPDYLKVSRFGAAEWAAAFSSDPDGMKRTPRSQAQPRTTASQVATCSSLRPCD
jgi:hypothetical protein